MIMYLLNNEVLAIMKRMRILSQNWNYLAQKNITIMKAELDKKTIIETETNMTDERGID